MNKPIYKAPTPPPPRRLKGRKRLALLLISGITFTLAGSALGTGFVAGQPPAAPVPGAPSYINTNRDNLKVTLQEMLQTLKPPALALALPAGQETALTQPQGAARPVPGAVEASITQKAALPPSPRFAEKVDPTAFAFRQQVAKAEAGLQTGRFEAVLDFGNGSHSSAEVIFNRTGSDGLAHFQIVTTYHNAGSAQTYERITIGSRSWDRQAATPWIELGASQDAWEQVRDFLPRASTITDPKITSDSNVTVMHWYDPDYDADMTLYFDPASGTPQQLRQVTRATHSTLTIVYRDWNTHIAEITPPAEFSAVTDQKAAPGQTVAVNN